MTTNIQTFSGNVGIGTNDPGSFKLNVNGTVSATSLTVNGITNSEVPSGLIAMWHGNISGLPTGWAFCDGNNGTPNLRNRFILCAEGDSPATPNPNQIGGQHTKEISVEHLPPHAHPISSAGSHDHGGTQGAGGHYHHLSGTYGKRIIHRGYAIQNNTGRVGNGNGVIVNDAYGHPGWDLHGNQGRAKDVGNHTHGLQSGGGHTHGGTQNVGDGDNFDVRPSYYVLAYIMKI